MKSIMKKSLMAGMSVCMVLSMMPATAMAAGSENVLFGGEVSGIPGAKETVMGYKLAPGWEIMGEDASRYTAQGTDCVSIDVFTEMRTRTLRRPEDTTAILKTNHSVSRAWTQTVLQKGIWLIHPRSRRRSGCAW